MEFYVCEGADSQSEGETRVGQEMVGGTRYLLRSPPSSVGETMFEILGGLLTALCSTVRGEDVWNTSLLDSGGTDRTTSKLMARECQEGNADV